MSPVDNSQYMKGIKEHLQRMQEHDRKSKIAEQKNRDELDGLVALVNSIFEKHKVSGRITKEHIRFNAEHAGHVVHVEDKALSHIIFDHYFPQPARKSYYHFTDLSAFKSIISNRKLRLSNLHKRFADGEFTTFYDEHGMDGYRKGGNVLGIDTGQDAIMSEIYFLSLTGSGFSFDGDRLWHTFGHGGKGVRLEFSVVPKTRDFREVYYSPTHARGPIPLLQDLLHKVKECYGIPLTFTYASKIGAFYIKGQFQNEDEFRFLVKRTADDYYAMHLVPVVTDESKHIAYIELDFDNDFAQFDLISIQPGFNCSVDDVAGIRTVMGESGLGASVLPKAPELGYI